MTKYSPVGIAPRATLAMGAAGALVGGAVSAARNIGKVQKEEVSREDAIRDIIREAGTTGLSTATGTAVVSALGLGGIFSLVGLVGVAVGTKYLTDKVLDKRAARLAPVRVKSESEENKNTLESASTKSGKSKKNK